MIGNYSARLTGSKRNLLALLASSVVFSAGCANMSSTAPAVNSLSSPATLSGKIHGGNQPVIGATVTLWYAGQNAPAVQAATTTTDATGSFAFNRGPDNQSDNGTTDTYSCPLTGGVADPVVYVVSKGGNTQNNGNPAQNNSAAAFIAIYGQCSQLSASNFVYMSEATTVATMAAVQQFFNPADDSIKADATGQQKLIMVNIPNTIALLADTSTGLTIPSKTIGVGGGGNIAAGVILTATPENAKLNTLANIISSCINGATSAATACSSLFAAAVPPIPNTTNIGSGTFAPATDTLQALYYIFTNPTNSGSTNINNLFALQPAVGAPYLPSLAAAPNDWTVGVSYTSSSSCTTGNFISSPTDINIDALDNVWFGNAQTGGNLSAISPAGAPYQCVNFDTGASSSGGTLDSAGNIWMAGAATLYRYNQFTHASLAFPVALNPLAITADGIGNIYFTAVTGSVGTVYELVGAATSVGAVTPLAISNTVGAAPLRLFPDFQGNATQGNIWVSSGSTFVSQLAPSSDPGNMNGFVTNPITTSGNSWGVSVGRANGVFVSSIDNGAIDQLVKSGSTYVSAAGWPFTAATAGISSPQGMTVDGRGNSWIANSGSPSISEVSFFGTLPLSPSTGFLKDTTYLNSNKAIAVDQAGNVWIAGSGNNFVTEIVGAGVPLYAPYAVGLANGRFQSIP